MFEKIKAFFDKKSVKITEGILIAVAATGLIIGGVSVEEVLPKIAKAVVGVVTAIEALITIIQGINTVSDKIEKK